MATEFTKDPSAILDYQVDWAAWLGTDTIDTSAWTVPTGITQTDASSTATTATIWLSGGTLGTSYLLTNRIVTAAGRQDERSFTLVIRDR